MKEPKLRFPEFTGEWKLRKLNEITDVRDGTHDSPKYVREGHPFVTSKNVSNGFINYNDVQYITDEDYEKINKRSKVDVHDILMGMIGTIGNLALIQKEPDFAIKNVALIKHTGGINYKYLYQALQAGYVTNQLTIGMDGGTQKFISLKKIRELDIPFPNELEQQKIGIFFSNLDNLIQSAEKELEGYRELKQGMLQKMFPKKGEKVPEIRFPEFTGDWVQHKLEDVVTIGSGKDYKHLESGNVPVYGTGGYMLSVNQALSENEDAVGIGRKGTIDKPYILRAPFWTVDTLFYCIPNKEFDLTFTNCLFQNVDWKKKDESTGVPSLSKVIINNVKTYVPSLPEQQRIGEYFSNLDNLIALQQKELDGYKELKKGLLQQMFC